jgi:hypothetical protein
MTFRQVKDALSDGFQEVLGHNRSSRRKAIRERAENLRQKYHLNEPYKQAIISYLEGQLARTSYWNKLNEGKEKAFRNILLDLQTTAKTEEELKDCVTNIRTLAKDHGDTGLWGTIKCKHFRNPKSLNALDEVFDSNNQLRAKK